MSSKIPKTPAVVIDKKQGKMAFENELQELLEKIRNLPSEATELEMPPVAKDSTTVYIKLCEVLKVAESGSILSQIDDEKMDLSYHAMGPVGIIPLTKALTLNTTIKHLDLKYNKIGPKGIPAVTSLVGHNDCVTHLNLAGNEIGKGSAAILIELISRCNVVEVLDLSNNYLGEEELPGIGAALMKVDSVKELNLSSNDFGPGKAQPFGSYINKCSALQKLDLSRCNLESGAMYVFGGLKISNLTVLNLSRNGIPNEAMQSLATGLRLNKTLQEVDISYNFISNRGAKVFAPSLKRSSTLEIMNLAHNPIDGSAATALLTSAGSNLKLLDLTGIRVNLAFFKTLRKYEKTGRKIRVLFGSEIRYDLLPRDLTATDAGHLSKQNVTTYLEKLADDKGVSLRNALKSIHATFLNEKNEKLMAEKEADKKDAGKKSAGKKDAGKKDAGKKGAGKKDAGKKVEEIKEPEKKEEEKPKDMTPDEFAKLLIGSAVAVPKAVAREIAELLKEEDGSVNMWKLIAGIRWKPDDLAVKIKPPEKTDTADEKKDKKKK